MSTGCDDGVGVGDGVSSNPAASSVPTRRFREAGSAEAGEAAAWVSIGVGGASEEGDTVNVASVARACAACGLSGGGGGAFGLPKKLNREGWLGFLAPPLGVPALVGAMVVGLIAPLCEDSLTNVRSKTLEGGKPQGKRNVSTCSPTSCHSTIYVQVRSTP